MPLLTPPGFALAAIHLSGPVGTPEFVTTIGIEAQDGVPIQPAHANTVMSAFGAGFTAALATDWTINKVSCHFGAPPDGESVDSSVTPMGGGSGGSRLPVQMAMVLQKKCGIGGRKNRGRMFLPGCLQTNFVDASGKVTAPQLDDFSNKCAAFLDALEVPTAGPNPEHLPVTPVLLHSGPEAPTPIIALVPARQVGWVRSRG